jgi:hypothetical protein
MANTTVPASGIYEVSGKYYAVRVDEIDVTSDRLSKSEKNITLATGKVELGTLTIGDSSKKVMSIGTVYRFK